MIKITGGKFKRKQLETISKHVRPTSSLRREAFFSIIESYALKYSQNLYDKKIFLDLFAGIGTMGLEAISRGMQKVIFFENNLEVIDILDRNCKKICNQSQYEIKEEDLEKSDINLNFNNISVIFVDPPYNNYNISNLLKILQGKINKNAIIGIESSIKDSFKIPEKLKIINQKKYGKTNLTFLILD